MHVRIRPQANPQGHRRGDRPVDGGRVLRAARPARDAGDQAASPGRRRPPGIPGRPGRPGPRLRPQRLAAALGRELLAPDRNAWIIDSAGDADRQLELAQHLVDHRADAIVVIPINPAAKGWAEIALQAPVIAIGDALPGAKAKSEVVLDNESGVTTALRRLADAGHRQVAVLSPSYRFETDRPAEEIAQRIAPGLKLKIRIIPCPHDLAGATEVARELLTGNRRPTGILALTDSIAFGVYAASRELGLRIPDDLSLLGYDDQPMSQLLTPPLSTFHWPLDELVADVVARVTS